MPEQKSERKIHVRIEEDLHGKHQYATDNCAKGNRPEGK